MAHKDWCGEPCTDCAQTCGLDESIPCSPDGKGLNTDGACKSDHCAVKDNGEHGCDSSDNWYDGFDIVAAETLRGWNWTEYRDRSGHLESPDGKGYFNYDLSTHEFRHPGIEGNNWRFFDESFSSFKLMAEKWIAENVLHLTTKGKDGMDEKIINTLLHLFYDAINNDARSDDGELQATYSVQGQELGGITASLEDGKLVVYLDNDKQFIVSIKATEK